MAVNLEAAVECDVLVVGAGPVGLTTAIGLASRGVRVRLIDGAEGPSHITKASGMATRCLELLPPDVVEDMQARGVRVDRFVGTESDSQGKVTKVLDINMEGRSDTFQGILAQPQWSYEEALRSHLEKIPDACRGSPNTMSVEWGVRLLSFENCADKVVVELQQQDRRETISVPWLIACDGGRSTIRRLLGLSFPGMTTPEYFFALHCSFEGLEARAGANKSPEEGATTEFLFSKASVESNNLPPMGSKDVEPKDPNNTSAIDPSLRGGLVFSMPMPEEKPQSNLVIVDLSPAQAARYSDGHIDKHGRHQIRQPTPEEVLQVMRSRGFGSEQLKMKPGTLKWCTQFTVNSRVTEHYRSGRVLLGGDASHCHTPLGGQGMNMGIQDAVNLSWKLAMVVKGLASPTLLDTYDEERRSTDKRIVKAVETLQMGASNRSAPFFFFRGMGQRAIGLMSSLFVPTLVKSVNMQIHSYNGLSLSTEHWERPPVFPWPTSRVLSPFPGGYRRQQNLFRWVATRVRAGDRLPNIDLVEAGCAGENVPEKLYPYTHGWMLLLFQGTKEGNEAQERNLTSDAKPMDYETLIAEGKRIQSACSPLIDNVIVIPGSAVGIYEKLGIRGQCLMLVRPDAYVGLRSEPVRAGIVARYFANQIKAPVRTNTKDLQAPASASSFDPAPLFAWGIIGLTAALVTTIAKRR